MLQRATQSLQEESEVRGPRGLKSARAIKVKSVAARLKPCPFKTWPDARSLANLDQRDYSRAKSAKAATVGTSMSGRASVSLVAAAALPWRRLTQTVAIPRARAGATS